jgi:hypothetical protein
VGSIAGLGGDEDLLDRSGHDRRILDQSGVESTR